MKIFTLAILASLTLGAAASEVPGTEYRTTTSRVIYVDTADVDESLDAPAELPADRETLRQIHGDPDEPKNQDMLRRIERTYDQKDTIESDYGNEIEHEILEDRDKFNDAEDGDGDDY